MITSFTLDVVSVDVGEQMTKRKQLANMRSVVVSFIKAFTSIHKAFASIRKICSGIRKYW